MTIKLKSSSGGSISINEPTTALDYTQTLVSVTDTLAPVVRATAQNSTSGTVIDFTGIPSWAKKINIIFNGVSTTGTSAIIVQVGSGSFVTTGYAGAATGYSSGSSGGSAAFTSGFGTEDASAANLVRYGRAAIFNISGNVWVFNSVLNATGTNGFRTGGGSVTLGDVLDRVRITTLTGTDTFDAGSINIFYE